MKFRDLGVGRAEGGEVYRCWWWLPVDKAVEKYFYVDYTLLKSSY